MLNIFQVYYTELAPAETLAIVTQYNAEAISQGVSPSSAVSSFKYEYLSVDANPAGIFLY